MFLNLVLGFVLGTLVAAAAWKLKALAPSGAIAAALTGGLIFGLGGLPWAALLLTFFISSSMLSRLFKQRKRKVEEKYAKGSQRDWGQVLANGGLGAVLVVVYAVYPHDNWTWAAYIGAMAAVNADTWATELGVFNRTPPRLITTGKIVEQGTSGGVSWLGTMAAWAGALLIGLIAALFARAEQAAGLLLASSLAGVVGSSVDSLLGASVQAIYWCPQCQKETERHPTHTCGSTTHLQRGWRWMNNDVVNLICGTSGAVVAVMLLQLLAK